MFDDKNGSGSNEGNGDGNSGHAVDPARSSGSSPPSDDTHPSLRSIREAAAWERKGRLSPLGYGGEYDYLAQRGRVFQSQPFDALQNRPGSALQNRPTHVGDRDRRQV